MPRADALNRSRIEAVAELYRIPVVATQVAASEEQAVALAEDLARPTVLKLHSQTITHKSDVGGVQLNLLNAEAVRRAYRAIEQSVSQRAGAEHFLGVTVQPMVEHNGYELILGCSPDPQFGPVLLFGAGGQHVELIRDSTLALPPLNTTLARRMMEQTRIFQFLQGPPVDLGALERLLVRFSGLVVEQPRIKEIDINPLLASPKPSKVTPPTTTPAPAGSPASRSMTTTTSPATPPPRATVPSSPTTSATTTSPRTASTPTATESSSTTSRPTAGIRTTPTRPWYRATWSTGTAARASRSTLATTSPSQTTPPTTTTGHLNTGTWRGEISNSVWEQQHLRQQHRRDRSEREPEQHRHL